MIRIMFLKLFELFDQEKMINLPTPVNKAVMPCQRIEYKTKKFVYNTAVY